MGWKVRAIRGATTATDNTREAITEAVTELLDRLEQHNQLDPEEIISVVFTTTKDLDAIFPAAIARHRPFWDNIALLDVQQMHVENDLERCIRVLIHLNVPSPDLKLTNVYLRHAENLRPDWSLSSSSSHSS